MTIKDFKAAARQIPIFGGTGGYAAGWYSFFSSMLAGTRIDYAQEAGRIYDNSVVGSAINWLWRNLQYPVLQVEQQVKNAKGQLKWEAIPHPLTLAVTDGPFYDDSVLWAGTMISWVANGNAYWYKVRSGFGQVVAYLYLPHMLVQPRADKYNPDGSKLITYYRYQVPGREPIEILPTEIVHFRHGIDPQTMGLKGLAPIAATLRSVVTENEADTISVALLRNAGIPGIVFSPKVGEATASPEKRTELKDRFREHTTGDYAGTPLALPFPVDVSMIGFSPEQMKLDGTRAIAVSRILAGIGIDPMVLGLPSETKTYSNYAEANEAAHEQVLLPLLMILAKQLTRESLRSDYKGSELLRVGWDLSQVRALQPDLDELWKRNETMWKAGGIKRKTLLMNIGEEYDDATDDVYFTDLIKPTDTNDNTPSATPTKP